MRRKVLPSNATPEELAEFRRLESEEKEMDRMFVEPIRRKRDDLFARVFWRGCEGKPETTLSASLNSVESTLTGEGR